MQTLTQPNLIPMPFANNGTKNTIPSSPTGTNLASFSEGFPLITSTSIADGGIPPSRADFNALGAISTEPAFFAQNGGSYTFNANVSTAIGGYPQNAILWYFPVGETPFLVQSLIQDNTYNFVSDPSYIDDIHWKKIALGGGGLEIGDIGIAPLGIDETENRRRYLNGQVVSQTQFVAFAQKVKSAIATYPSLGTTEALWQQAVSDSDLGQCGQFVVDDVNGTIRLPKIVNIQGLQTLSGNLGTTISAGLPNIEGSFSYDGTYSEGTGAFRKSSAETTGSSAGTGSDRTMTFDASRSSSIYGNSSTVQEEAVQYPYFIQVATGGETDIDVTTEIQLSNPFFFGMYQWFQTDPNNASWLEANGTYSAKTVYPSFYDWLLSIYNDTGSITGFNVKDTTDTYDDYDFVLNLNDETFRLPTKVHGKTGDAVIGNDMTLGLTDGTDNGGCASRRDQDGAHFLTGTFDGYGQIVGTSVSGNNLGLDVTVGVTSDPTKSGVEVDTTGMTLYFYVGAVVQDADVINAGAIINEVATINSRPYVVEEYVNGAYWYRIWSNKVCEQGGPLHGDAGSGTGATVVQYLVEFADTNYTLVTNVGEDTSANISAYRMPYSKTTTGFSYNKSNSFIGSFYARGYIA